MSVWATELGQFGRTVERVQAALAVSPADGLAGERTQAAIRKYQREHGLDETGVIDAALLRTMGLG